MDLRVIARVRETSEDLLLQGIEPEGEVSFVWRKKYVKPFDIEKYWELEKGKTTVVSYSDETLDIIKEDIDKFAKRLEAKREEAREKGEFPVEDDIEIEYEEEPEVDED